MFVVKHHEYMSLRCQVWSPPCFDSLGKENEREKSKERKNKEK